MGDKFEGGRWVEIGVASVMVRGRGGWEELGGLVVDFERFCIVPVGTVLAISWGTLLGSPRPGDRDPRSSRVWRRSAFERRSKLWRRFRCASPGAGRWYELVKTIRDPEAMLLRRLNMEQAVSKMPCRFGSIAGPSV